MWRCEEVDLQMWRCEDVDLQMWRCEDVDLQVWGCEDVDLQMWGCEDVDQQMWRCEDVDLQMWGCEDVDLQMWRCEDVDLQVWGCEDVDLQMWGCEDVDQQMWRCEDVDQQVWGCEDVDQQMWGCEDVLQRLLFYEGPFAGALGNHRIRFSQIQPDSTSLSLPGEKRHDAACSVLHTISRLGPRLSMSCCGTFVSWNIHLGDHLPMENWLCCPVYILFPSCLPVNFHEHLGTSFFFCWLTECYPPSILRTCFFNLVMLVHQSTMLK